LVLWILFQLIGALEQRAGMSSVSSIAHLGGAAVGVVAWLLWKKQLPEAATSKFQAPEKLQSSGS